MRISLRVFLAAIVSIAALFTSNHISAQTNCAPVPAGLVGWWAGEGNAADSTGANNGLLEGGVTFLTGEVGQAFSFNGTDADVRVPASPALDVGTGAGMTIEAWIKPADLSTERPILEWNDGSFGTLLNISVPVSGGGAGPGSFTAGLKDTGLVLHLINSPPGVLNTSYFQHLAVTYDKTSGVAVLYLNGSVVAQAGLGIFTPRTIGDLYFGLRAHDAGAGMRFAGQMDEVSIYGRALSAAEIQAIAAAGRSGKCGLAPVIAIQPQSQTVLVGTTVTLSVTASGTPPLTYQWQLNTNNIPGATGSSLVLTHVQLGDAGAYAVIVSNSVGSVTSANAVLTVNPPPPCVGTPSGLLGWWRGEGNTLDDEGGNNAQAQGALAFAAGEVGQGFVFNGTDAYVKVPASSSLNVGLGSGFTVEAWIKPADVSLARPLVEWNSGAGPAPYGVHFWISQPLPYGNGPGCLFANLIDTTGGDHWFTSAAGLLTNNAWHHVALTYAKASGLAVFYVNGSAVAQQNLGTLAPQTATDFYLGARVAGPGSALWVGQMDEVSLYNRALSAAELQAIAAAGSSGKCGLPPVIAIQPQSQTVVGGTTVTLSVTASGSPPLSYQWQLNGTNLPGATGSSLVLTPVQLGDAGAYAVVVSNSAGTATSANAVLTVNPPPPCAAAPSGLVGWWRGEGNTLDDAAANTGLNKGGLAFAQAEVGQGFVFNGTDAYVKVLANSSLNVGLGAGFTVEAWIKPADVSLPRPLVEWNSGAGPAPYGVHFWISQPLPYGNGPGCLFANLIDTTGGSHTFPSAAGLLTNNAWHHVALTYAKASGLAVFYLNGSAVAQQSLGTLTPQTATDFYLGARVAGPGSALWVGQMDEVSLYNRALSAAEVQAIHDAAGSGKCALAPAIVTQPQSQTVVLGATVTFCVRAAGSPPLSCQWQLNGSNIPGATGSSLVLTNVQFADAGPYAALVSNSAGTATSANAVLTVTQFPVCVTAPSGLAGWWPGEGTANDSHGTNNGLLEGGVSFLPGEVGQAFSFNGTNADVRVPASPGINIGPSNGMTIEAWIKPADLSTERPIVEWNNGSFGALLNISVPLSSGGTGPGSFTANLIDSGSITHLINSPPGVLNTGNFQHLAVAYDKASGAANLYLNGALVAQANLGTFTPRTLGDLYFGLRAHGAGAGMRFLGQMDELAIYSRALADVEIQAIYNAGSAGKCGLAPVIAIQPRSQTAVAGTNVTLSVTAGGTPPLSYQWQLNTNIITGATGSSLLLTNLQMTDAGAYSVIVSNSVGSVTSSTAVLTVTYPPALVQAANVTAVGNGTVTVPILLVANGNENALGFTLDFNPAMLTYTGLTLGAGATNATLVSNAGQAANGFLGVGVALPTDTAFAAGTQEVAEVSFTAAITTNAASTTVGFSNQVVKCQVADAKANPLPAKFAAGLVSIAATPFEGDLSPRPDGDQAITVTDWVLEGRYAARLDYPTNASEFQRADCAPRATLGDGAITVIDWVQVGRYMAGLDPWTPAGGPTAEHPLVVGKRVQRDPPSGPLKNGLSRQVQVLDAVLLRGQPGTLWVNLKAQGNENALGFSLSFDPAVLTYTGAAPGSSLSGAGGAMFILNDQQAASGRLGFTLALQPGSSFAAGDQQVAKIGFSAASAASGSYPVALGNQPVPCQVSDPAASPLTTDYVNGTVIISPPPTLGIAQSGQAIGLSWPLWASNFVLQQASGDLSPGMNWSSLGLTPAVTTNANVVTLPLSSTNKFYRLLQK